MEKRMMAICLVLALLLGCVPASADLTGNAADFPKGGFSWQVPDMVKTLSGQIVDTGDIGETRPGSGIIFAYMVYTTLTEKEVNDLMDRMEALSDEGKGEEAAQLKARLTDSAPLLFLVIGVRDSGEGFSLDTVMNELLTGYVPGMFRAPAEIGTLDGYTYFVTVPAPDSETIRKAETNLGRETTEALVKAQDEIMAHPECFILKERTETNVYPEPGTKVSFITKDIEGKEATSETLFSRNRVTLVNLWQTFCEPCKEEMPELDRLNREYAGKGFEVIGVVCDVGNDEGRLEKARTISGKYSIRTLLLSKDLHDSLPAPQGTPTSYFIDSEGKILGYPVVGKHMDQILAGIEQYLDGKTVEVPTEPAEVSSEPQTWTVRVTDQNGEPVPEVTVSFCTASACQMVELAEDGTGSYTGPAGQYHVSIVEAPDEYDTDNVGDIYTDEHSSSLTIVLTRH